MLIVGMLTKAEIPYSYYDDIYKYRNIDFSGYSYLLKPEKLLYNSYKYSNSDLARYVGLAARRPYSDYVVNHNSALDLRTVPFDPLAYFDNQELVEVKGDYLHFLYE